MESDKDLIVRGEDVTGKVAINDGYNEIDMSGDRVDALPQAPPLPKRVDALPQAPPLPKSFSEENENLKIYVHQCKDDEYYETNHTKRGKAVIFNHKNFDLHLETRYGTEIDCQNLEKTLRTMNFDVVTYDDLNFKQLDAVLEELAASDFSDCDCLLIVVLSHGEPNSIYAKNMSYSNNVLFDHFTPDKCPTLAGKPKIFIIQACQGNKLAPGINVECDKLDSGVTSYRMPLHADFLFAYSTIPGYYSWRNTSQGSWFVRALCEELDRHWKNLDFLTILTFVNRRVALDFESHVPDSPSMHRQKQVSTFTSQLTRILKFRPKTVDNNANGVLADAE